MQARATSTRFPNKIFSKIKGKTIIHHLIDTLSEFTDNIVFAIPDTKGNDILDDYLVANDINVFRGTENDVLGRFYHCAKWYGFDTIIRVCADTPLIKYIDIATNFSRFVLEDKKRMIYGNGSWIFSFEMLEEAHLNQRHAESREHVCRSMQYSIDYPDDIERLEKLTSSEDI